jgi:hypothetical protein
MTHGSALSLLIVFVSAILMTRRFDIFRSKTMWICAATASAIVIPWYLFAFRYMSNGPAQGGLLFAAEELPRVLRLYPTVLGPGLLSLAIAGAISVAYHVIRRSTEVPPLDVICLSLFVVPCIFYPLVPAGVEARRLMAIVPAAICLAIVACCQLAGKLQDSLKSKYLRPEFLFITTVLLLQGRSLAAYHKPQIGYQEIVQALFSDPHLSTANVLMSIDSDGAVIAGMAAVQPDPSRYLVCARKMFAVSDWSGAKYRLVCHSPEEAMHAIERSPINALLIDSRDGGGLSTDNELLWQAVEKYPSHWKLLRRFPGHYAARSKDVFIYLLDDGRTRPGGVFTLHMEGMTGNTLESTGP